jgi:lipopolysaccharide export system permease protein
MSWWPLHLAALVLIVLLFVWRNNTNLRWHPSVWLALARKLVVSPSGAAR